MRIKHETGNRVRATLPGVMRKSRCRDGGRKGAEHAESATSANTSPRHERRGSAKRDSPSLVSIPPSAVRDGVDIGRGITVVRESDNPRRMAETVRSEPFRDDITMRERLIERRFNDDHRQGDGEPSGRS